jgi:hypothetical protein
MRVTAGNRFGPPDPNLAPKLEHTRLAFKPVFLIIENYEPQWFSWSKQPKTLRFKSVKTLSVLLSQSRDDLHIA